MKSIRMAPVVLASILMSTMVMPAAAAAGVSLKVMSFNIRYGTADDGENAWQHRKELVADTIRSYDPVLVGLQECLAFQAEFLVEALPDYRWFGVGRDADGSGERMAVMYKPAVLNPLQTGNYWLCETPNVPGTRSWEAACNRMVTWGKFYRHTDKQMIYFFNTHFDHESEEARQGAADVLRDQVAQIAGEGPVIVTGDFNARAQASVAWEKLTNAGFIDSWLAAEKLAGPAITWSGFTAPDPNQDRRIDWILLRGGLKALHCETVTFNKNGQYPSDHFPVYAEIAFHSTN